MKSNTSRRAVLASIPAVVAATAAPVAVLAASSETSDPIFAAIEGVKSARQVRDALHDEWRAFEDKMSIEFKFSAGRVWFAAGCFKGQPLYVSSEEELYDTLSKRYIALLADRGVSIDKGTDRNSETPEQVWFGIEIQQTFKHFKEVMEARERYQTWRQESGYARAEEAFDAADDALTEAQQVLVDTKPTTAAGLVALLELIAANEAPYNVDDWQDIVFPTIAETARQFLTA